MKLSQFRLNLVATLFCLIPAFCNAHPGHADTMSLVSGLIHPFSGLDHFLVILLVGFWSALAFKRMWFGPMSFLAGMLLGSITGLFAATTQTLEFAISASVIATGVLLLVNRKFSEQLSLTLLASFGVIHGLAHTGYLPALNGENLTSIGMDLLGLLIGTATLHFAGLLCAKNLIKRLPLMIKATGLGTLLYGSFLLTQLALS